MRMLIFLLRLEVGPGRALHSSPAFGAHVGLDQRSFNITLIDLRFEQIFRSGKFSVKFLGERRIEFLGFLLGASAGKAVAFTVGFDLHRPSGRLSSSRARPLQIDTPVKLRLVARELLLFCPLVASRRFSKHHPACDCDDRLDFLATRLSCRESQGDGRDNCGRQS